MAASVHHRLCRFSPALQLVFRLADTKQILKVVEEGDDLKRISACPVLCVCTVKDGVPAQAGDRLAVPESGEQDGINKRLSH